MVRLLREAIGVAGQSVEACWVDDQMLEHRPGIVHAPGGPAMTVRCVERFPARRCRHFQPLRLGFFRALPSEWIFGGTASESNKGFGSLAIEHTRNAPQVSFPCQLAF